MTPNTKYWNRRFKSGAKANERYGYEKVKDLTEAEAKAIRLENRKKRITK